MRTKLITSFSKLCYEWLQQHQYRISKNTYDAYTLTRIKHLEPYFKDRDIRTIDIDQIEKYYIHKIITESLSVDTVSKHRTLLNGVFRFALKRKIIHENPVLNATLPRKQNTFVGDYLLNDDLYQCLKTVHGDWIELPVLLAVYMGLRRSEICGLKWKDINLKQKCLAVRNTVVISYNLTTKESELIIKENRAKNDTSCRILSIPDFMVFYFKTLRKRQLMNYVHNKKDYNTSYMDFVFINEKGELISPNIITTRFRKLMKNSDCHIVRFHDLRHTCATMLLEMGTSFREIQEWLGHACISTTMRYAHVDLSQKKRISEQLNQTYIELAQKES